MGFPMTPHLYPLLFNYILFEPFEDEILYKTKIQQKVPRRYKKSHKNTIPNEFIECQQVFSLMVYMWASKKVGRV